jgi:hypothetical protein
VARRAKPFDVRVETLTDDGHDGLAGTTSGEIAWGGLGVARHAAAEAVRHSGSEDGQSFAADCPSGAVGAQSGAADCPSGAVGAQSGAADGLSGVSAEHMADEGITAVATPDMVRVTAAHDGYRRLSGRPIHRRRWDTTADRLRVTDWIEGRSSTSVARLHLHPDVRVEFDELDSLSQPTGIGEGRTGILRLPAGQCARWRLTGGRVELESGFWHPEFGHSVPNRCLVLRLTGNTSTFELAWDPAGSRGETT